MNRSAASVWTLAGAALALVSLFLNYFDLAGAHVTYFQLYKHWDVVTAVMGAAIICVAIASMSRASYSAAIGLVTLSALLCGNLLIYAVESTHGTAIGAYLGGAGSVVALVGSLAVARSDLTVRTDTANSMGLPGPPPPPPSGLPYAP